MKRLILSAFLGMAGLVLPAGAIQAGPFGGCCNSGCGKCGANFCVRQYNAFSPVCFGTVHCDGINPLGGSCIPGGYNSQPCAGCAMPWGMPGPSYGMPMPMHQPMPMPAPGAAPMPMLPPPGAQPLPMPQPGSAPAAMMGYPYYMQPMMMPNQLMPAAYGYPVPYGYQPQQPMMATQPQQ